VCDVCDAEAGAGAEAEAEAEAKGARSAIEALSCETLLSSAEPSAGGGSDLAAAFVSRFKATS
jgi:hypothetical protein